MPSVAHVIRRRRSRKRRRRKEARRGAFWFALIVGLPLALILTPLLASLALSTWLYLAAASQMPAPQATVFPDLERGVTRFYDASGRHLVHALADPLGADRTWLRLDALPLHLINAAALAENGNLDAELGAFEPIQALTQVWRYILGLPGAAERGIAGNLARETIAPMASGSGLDARLMEIVLAAESKRLHSGEALLEWRLNSAYYGRDAFGIEAAAQVYLGKPAAALALAESAVLAAIVAEPSLNPLDAPIQARERATDLLFQLREAGLIDKSQFDAASAAELNFLQRSGEPEAIAPAFIDFARDQAEYLLDRGGLDGARLVARGGLRVTTTLNMDLQLRAHCLLRARLRPAARAAAPCELTPGFGSSEDALSPPEAGSLALIDVGGGRILALVGEAHRALGQPAVVLQPFVYLDAFLRRDFTPASMVYDLPLSYPGAQSDLIFTPANPDGMYRGPLNLRDAMASWLFPPAAQVADAAGMERAIRAAQSLGFNSLDGGDHSLDLLERGGGVASLDSAYAYSVLAAMGEMRGIAVPPQGDGFRARDPVAILRIEDAEGRLLWSHDEDPRHNQSTLIQASAAYMVNDILADADAREKVLGQGEGSLRLSRPAALVDGMSADKRDSWTVGYTPDLVLAVHTSREEGAPLSLDEYERAGSAPVWLALMEYALERLRLPLRAWVAPADIEEFLVCEISGLLPPTTAHCPNRREIVPAGSRMQRDQLWHTVEINRETGLLATVNTPAELRESAAYFAPPDEIMEWWLENDKPLPPTSYSSDAAPGSAKPVRLVSPADYAYVGAQVDVEASVSRAGAQSWRLEYGVDVNPDSWREIAEGQSPAASGEISATWETALFSGIYTLRLSATFADGSVETDTKLLTFDNTPPAVTLRLNDAVDAPRYPSQPLVSLLAQVSDNLTIERVEFYRDDELLAADRAWPYGHEFSLDGAGEATLRAVAYDQVGNRAASQLTLSVQEG